MVDAYPWWAVADIKAAAATKLGKLLVAKCYLMVQGKLLEDGDPTTLGELGVDTGSQVELRFRGALGGMGCTCSKVRH